MPTVQFQTPQSNGSLPADSINIIASGLAANASFTINLTTDSTTVTTHETADANGNVNVTLTALSAVLAPLVAALGQGNWTDNGSSWFASAETASGHYVAVLMTTP